MYELSQLALKFERHLDAEIVDCQARSAQLRSRSAGEGRADGGARRPQMLSEDYAKLAFMCNHRGLEFHAKYGVHHRLRLPFQGRAMAYCPATAELLCVGSSPSICR